MPTKELPTLYKIALDSESSNSWIYQLTSTEPIHPCNIPSQTKQQNKKTNPNKYPKTHTTSTNNILYYLRSSTPKTQKHNPKKHSLRYN